MATTVTLCVQNIPCKVLEDDFVRMMTGVGLDVSRYTLDFPKRRGRQQRPNNFGYGFVACRQEEDAWAFKRLFQDFQFENIMSAKRLRVEMAFSNQQDIQIGGCAESWNHMGGDALPTLPRMTSPAEYEVPPTRLSDSLHGFWSEGSTAAKRPQVSGQRWLSQEQMTVWQ
eukprot:TRINITY_DN41482_c0_g1_i1.p1 TRINITY_DN41482_c0_g1~~TRINITY_DN41482_c0_g1_i1.p1  ORF type:complete len:170 (+),score=13.45 TRINITY_DN41482_c0_g1_i1:37-546(+)